MLWLVGILEADKTSGDDEPGRTPVLLIHASTMDGPTDWFDTATEFAKY